MKWQIRNIGSLYSDSYDLVMLLIYSTLVCKDHNQVLPHQKFTYEQERREKSFQKNLAV